MNDARLLRHQVRNETKSFKRDAKESLSCSDMRRQISEEKKSAEQNYKQEQKILRQRVKAETSAYKILSRG